MLYHCMFTFALDITAAITAATALLKIAFRMAINGRYHGGKYLLCVSFVNSKILTLYIGHAIVKFYTEIFLRK